MEGPAGIDTVPPSIAVDAVAEAVARQFGQRGTLRPLVSERDQNFCLETGRNGCFLVKVTSAAEAASTTELQVGALRHLASHAGVIAPRVVPTLAGDAFGWIEGDGSSHRLRLLSWVEGEQLETLDIDPALAARFGRALAGLDRALAGYGFEGPNPEIVWDLQRVTDLRSIIRSIDDAAVRARVQAAVDDYESRVVPVIDRLPQQVIHADANPENALLDHGAIGFIDFGDMVRAPRVFDPGIAGSYLRTAGDDPLVLLRPFLAGYHAALALDRAEIDVLFDVVRGRLATSVTLLHWRLRDRPESDQYRRKSLLLESNASHFLAALDATGRDHFTLEIRQLLFGPRVA